MLIAPAFLSNPILKNLAAALHVLGWLALLGGVALFGIYKAATRNDRKPGTASTGSAAGWSATPDSDASRRRRGSAVGDITSVARAAAVGDDQVIDMPSGSSSTSHPARPPVPNTWSAAVFDLIEWRRFEAVCEWLFSQAGFETKTQSHGADGGIDIWLYSKNFAGGPVSVVQCKHWKTQPVKVAEVRALLGSMTDKKVQRGIFATTSTFTADARQFAQANKIQLLERSGLLELITKRTAEQQSELLAVATKGEFWIPTCPSCGVKMARRSRKRDGAAFWGCVNFPRCKTMING